MIDKSFLEKISDMSAEVKTLVFGDDMPTFTSKKIYQVPMNTPSPLRVHTLTAIVDYCERMFMRDQVYGKGCFVNVLSPETVEVYSDLDGKYREREKYISATLQADQFQFGKHMRVEEFIVGLQSNFVQCDNTAAILRVVGNITAEAKHKTLDDGVSQQVIAKTGIATVENVTLPNPVLLAPHRTFPEVEQPMSRFVLRINAKPDMGPTCALFEADGGAWKNTAICTVKEWLEDRIENLTVLA